MNQQEAEALYRTVWYQYCLTSNSNKKGFLEALMDDIQPSIAKSPADPRWNKFIETLPGYTDFWDNCLVRVCEDVEKKCGTGS